MFRRRPRLSITPSIRNDPVSQAETNPSGPLACLSMLCTCQRTRKQTRLRTNPIRFTQVFLGRADLSSHRRSPDSPFRALGGSLCSMRPGRSREQDRHSQPRDGSLSQHGANPAVVDPSCRRDRPGSKARQGLFNLCLPRFRAKQARRTGLPHPSLGFRRGIARDRQHRHRRPMPTEPVEKLHYRPQRMGNLKHECPRPKRKHLP